MDPWEAELQVWALRMRGPRLSLGCFMPLSKLGKGTLSITTFIVIYWKMIATNVPSYNVCAVSGILWVCVTYSLCNGVQWPPFPLCPGPPGLLSIPPGFKKGVDFAPNGEF